MGEFNVISFNKILIVSMTFVVLLFFYARAEWEQPLTLEQSIEIALKNSPNISAAYRYLASRRNEVKKVWSGWFPHFSLILDYYYTGIRINKNTKSPSHIPSWVPIEYTDLYTILFLPSDSDKYVSRIGIGLDQLLFDNGEVSNSISIARIEQGLALLNLKSLERDLSYNVIVAYYELLEAEQTVKLKESLVKQKEEIVQSSEGEFKAGTLLEQGLISVKLELAKAQAELLEVQNMEQDKKDTFLQLLNMPMDTRLELDNKVTYSPVEIELDKAIDYVLTNNLEIKKQKLQTELKRHELKLARSQFWPSGTIEGSFGYERFHHDFKESLRDFDRNWYVGVNVNWPFFSGGETFFNTKAAKERYEASEKELEVLEKETKQEIYRKYRGLKNIERRLEILKKSEELTARNLEIGKTQYKQGVITERDFLDKQIALDEVSLEKTKTLFHYKIKKADFFRCIGVSDESEIK